MRHVLVYLALIAIVLACVALTGCVAPQRAAGAEQAYIVNAQGATSPTSRSALAGSTAPGKQEIIGLYIPFVGTGLAVKAGLEWDGTPVVIEVPVASAPQAAPAGCVEEQVTEMVPETRMVPRTRTVRRALVPVPQAAPMPCPPAPAPQRAPGCEPTAAVPEACPDDGVCTVPATVAQR